MRVETFLPGHMDILRGSRADYEALARFHYLPKRPATFAGIWAVRYEEGAESRVVGVGVLSWPTARCRGRELHFGLAGLTYREKILFANANLRTISRVIVHPQFRSLGLASVIVKQLCAHASTRYVEALAVMGRVHPFFERGGMRKVEADGDGPVYFICDKGGAQ